MKGLNYLTVLLLALVSCLSASSQDLFHKDWIWNYQVLDWYYDADYRFSMAFGNEVEINGKLWHEFKTISSQCCLRDYETGIFYEDEYFDLPCVKCYYVREENGCWYTLCRKGGSYIESSEEFQNSTEFGERLIYDFNCQPGESFIAMEYQMMCETEIVVHKTFMVCIDGTERRGLTYSWHGFGENSPLIIIEGIDPSWGILCGLNAALEAGTGFVAHPNMPEHGLSPGLQNVVDEYGNVIFEDLEDVIITNITSVTEEQNCDWNSKYDFFGREISNPAPGTIYIQSGRKYIAK